eukprot:gene24121-9696_t
MSFGKIHCFLVALKSGEVIYERFYDRLSEADKAEARAAMQQASDGIRPSADDQDFAAAYRSTRFVFIPTADLVFYLMGSGEYDELACADILRSIMLTLKDVIGKAPTGAVLMDKYSKLCVILDEMINEVGCIEFLSAPAR